jgi:hypothetical protein
MEMAGKDNSDGRCPACRIPYDKEKIVGMAANCERLTSWLLCSFLSFMQMLFDELLMFIIHRAFFAMQTSG